MAKDFVFPEEVREKHMDRMVRRCLINTAIKERVSGMDDLDRAKTLSDMHTKFSIEAARRKADPGRESALECEDCGCPIPERRRQAVPGCVRCVRCQEEDERC